MTDCVIRNNRVQSYGDDQFSLADGGGLYASGTVRLTRCDFVGNLALASNDNSYNVSRGGGAALGDSALLNSCLFSNNEARSISGPDSYWGNDAYGGGLYCESALINECRFEGNSAESLGNPEGNTAAGGGLYSEVAFAVDCLFVKNSVSGPRPGSRAFRPRAPHAWRRPVGGGGAVTSGSHFIGCTFSGNSAQTSGAAVHMRDPGTITFDNTIIAFSMLASVVECAGGAFPVLSCCDVFGNTGGDWVGCLAGQSGVNGNFSADPLFCLPADHNYTIDANSPCAPEHAPGECGLIGALPVGCGATAVAEADAPAARPVVRVLPNPLSGQGFVSWDDTGAGPRMAQLYNLAGRLVLERELMSPGPGGQQIAWSDLTAGTELASGVYFLRLAPFTAEGSVRVLLMK